MRKIKASSSYLKNQVRKNLAKAALSLLIFGVIIFALALRVLSTLQVGLLEEVGLLFSLAPLVAFYFYLRKYRIYSGGWEGEKQVAKLLTSKLGDDYYLINDLYLHRRRRRHRPCRPRTQRRVRVGNKELERQHNLQRRRMAEAGQTQLFCRAQAAKSKATQQK